MSFDDLSGCDNRFRFSVHKFWIADSHSLVSTYRRQLLDSNAKLQNVTKNLEVLNIVAYEAKHSLNNYYYKSSFSNSLVVSYRTVHYSLKKFM